MNPAMYRVQDRVYGLGANGRRILAAVPGDEISMERAHELGLVKLAVPPKPPDAAQSVRPVSSATSAPAPAKPAEPSYLLGDPKPQAQPKRRQGKRSSKK